MSESDLATVVAWDPVEGFGAVRTDKAGHDVWIGYSAATGGLEPVSLVTGARVAVTYEPTPDQDGYRWIAGAVASVDVLDARDGSLDVTVDDTSFSKLVIGRRPPLSAAVGLVALVVSALVAFGAIVAVAVSGATLVRGADGVSIVEWAPPLAVWQWLVGGAIEFALIGASAAAWWGAWSLWAGRDFPGLKLTSPRPFALCAGFAMIAAAVLALVTHIQSWRDWHALVAHHPEWGEASQAWQIPAGAVAVALLVGAVLVVMLLLRKRPLAR